MTGTALLLIEILEKYKDKANFITLSEKILGRLFKIITFVVYISLFVSLTLAYMKGGGRGVISDLFGTIPASIGCLFFLAFLFP